MIPLENGCGVDEMPLTTCQGFVQGTFFREPSVTKNTEQLLIFHLFFTYISKNKTKTTDNFCEHLPSANSLEDIKRSYCLAGSWML